MSGAFDLSSPLWGGISGIATILGLVVVVAQSVKTRRTEIADTAVAKARTPQLGSPSSVLSADTRREHPPSVAARVGGAVLAWFITLVLWGCIWAVIAFPFGYDPWLVSLATPLIVMGSLAAWGALATMTPVVGGFIGGGAPFGIYALWTYAQISQNGLTPQPPNPLAWFVIFLLLGGLLGSAVALVAITIVRKAGIPLPRS